jgi:cytochrome c2
MRFLKLLVILSVFMGLMYACERGGKANPSEPVAKVNVKTDAQTIAKGKELFESKCSFCHDPNSTRTVVGPGLKGILKRDKLPVSKRPATPENVMRQLKEPDGDMPSFSYLSEKELEDIIAYLNTI